MARSAQFGRTEVALMVAVPVAWAVLLLFHPTGDGDEFYEQHDGQTRKGTTIPYVSHVLAVTASAMEMKPDTPGEAIGALLHDVVEDSGRMQRAREIAQRFGFDVPRIVLAKRSTSIRTHRAVGPFC